ncbi:BlaI/MecI/CopY family transcriptional regulator [uncultured Gimesia sp.]|uniref:BlaI/MecI/CopY family transcriptional regulator n=1 Tax=uncultured Gimesia sp. TaxID=1678688 RepID=UPI0030D93018|tara:strand:- start:221857 stop:222255 length:399 start_codon:yes stop_codon:yes gene_type:complete
MARPGSDHPTKLELEILKILWDESPLPVRDVRAKLETEADRALAHSSVITTLNIMYDKGLLRRRKEGKSFLFSPKVEKDQIAGGIMGDLLSRLFDGSPSAMMLNLLETTDINSSELAELRKLITRKAKEQSK